MTHRLRSGLRDHEQAKHINRSTEILCVAGPPDGSQHWYTKGATASTNALQVCMLRGCADNRSYTRRLQADQAAESE